MESTLCNTFKKLTASLEIKLVNITLCKCSWYILRILSDLAYGVSEGLFKSRENVPSLIC